MQSRIASIGFLTILSILGGCDAKDKAAPPPPPPEVKVSQVLQRDVPKWGKAVKDSGAVAD